MLRLTREQVRAIDRRATEEYRVPSILLMENASRGVADAAERYFLPRPSRVLVLCGGGNNGGDGLAAARHLHNRGHALTIGLLTDPARYRGDAKINWDIIQSMRLPASPTDPDAIRRTRADLILDAIFGTGLTDAPRDPFPQIVDAIRAHGAPVLAVDLPSGLDCDTGRPPGACVRATRTVTFVAEKTGFANPVARQYTGEITVADIGCPRELIEEVNGRSERV
jgi:NAD(P)H-hydrate epimerase